HATIGRERKAGDTGGGGQKQQRLLGVVVAHRDVVAVGGDGGLALGGLVDAAVDAGVVDPDVGEGGRWQALRRARLGLGLPCLGGGLLGLLGEGTVAVGDHAEVGAGGRGQDR